jgi:hypothetical protein
MKQVVCLCRWKTFCLSHTVDSTCFPARRERQKQSGWLRPLKNSQRAFQSVTTDGFQMTSGLKSSATTTMLTINGEGRGAGISQAKHGEGCHVSVEAARRAEDLTATNQRGSFWHSHDVTVTTVNDKGDAVTAKQRQAAICFHATKPGKDCPKKPRVAEVFNDEDEMGDRTAGRKK